MSFLFELDNRHAYERTSSYLKYLKFFLYTPLPIVHADFSASSYHECETGGFKSRDQDGQKNLEIV